MKVAPQLYTIGDTTTGKGTPTATSTLVTAYEEFMTAEQEQLQQHNQTFAFVGELQDYVHVLLNVPADCSGTRPHQALINFQSTSTTTQTTSSSNSQSVMLIKNKNNHNSNKKKKKNKNGQKKKEMVVTSSLSSSTPTMGAHYSIRNDVASNPTDVVTPTTATTTNIASMMIVKIQMAAPLHELDTIQHPMLLYNESRTVKTFVHPTTVVTTTTTTTTSGTINKNIENKDKREEKDDGYTRIAQWIHQSGVNGVLGSSGGMKAYFYATILTNIDEKLKPRTAKTTTTIGHEDIILSIYMKELAPPQQW